MYYKRRFCIIAIIMFLAFVSAIFYNFNFNLFSWTNLIIKADINSLLFIILLFSLPIIGFPISVLFALAGIKFGLLFGILLALLSMPVHMLFSYILARVFFRVSAEKFIQRKGYKFPDISDKKVFSGAVLFLALPGPPYVLKNYILALTEIPLLTYILINWSIQGIFALPIVGLGSAAAEKDWTLALIFVGFFVVLFLLRWVFKSRKNGVKG